MRTRISYPHLSEAEGFSHIESYLQSGLRPSEYYRSHSLSEHQFYYWYKRYSVLHRGLSATGSGTSGETKALHELKFDKPSTALSVSSFCGLEIHYPHGVKVVLPAGMSVDVDMLSALIKLVV